MPELTHQDIMLLHDKSFTTGQNNREKASDDIVFSRLTNWDDTLLSDVLTEYRGEFNIIRKQRRKALKDLQNNNVSIEFKPLSNQAYDDSELLNGLYRASTRENTSQSSIDIAYQDVVDCGFGCWRLTTEYENTYTTLDNNQKISRKIIHEANNVVFFDPNARERDKSDANYCTVLTSFSIEGWERFAKENKIDSEEFVPNFSAPAQSYVYPWTVEPKVVRIGEFFYREKKKEKVFIYQNPIGETVAYKASELGEKAEELDVLGFEKVGTKTREYYEVYKYLVSGQRILTEPEKIVGEYIPIIPIYGEWSFVEGAEVYEGLTRLAKDPQRLHNFQMSYLADIVSKGSRKKPFFLPEQIQGYEYLYEQNGAEFNFPYYLLNNKAPDGSDLPKTPLGYMEQPEMPQAVGTMIELTRQSIEDTTGVGVNASGLDVSNTSGKAISLQHRRADSQQIDFQRSLEVALRHDATVFLSMTKQIQDSPRKLSLVNEQGQNISVQTQLSVFNSQTGKPQVINDLSKGEYDVYGSISEPYETIKQETKDNLKDMYAATVQSNPELANIMLLQYLTLSDGTQMKLLRDYANKQLLVQGLKEPETPEEAQMLQQLQAQQQQQSQQQDPATMALVQQAQAQAIESEAKAEQAKANSIKAIADSEKIRAETAKVLAQVNSEKLDNVNKLVEHLQSRSPLLQSYKSELSG